MQNLKPKPREPASEMVQVAFPCPACGEPVSAIADVLSQKSRWCCTSCLLIGAVPWAIVTEWRAPNHPKA